GHAVRDHALANLAVLERLDHALLEGHPLDPAVALDHVIGPLASREVMVLPPRRASQATRSQVAPVPSTVNVTARPEPPSPRSAVSIARATASPGPSTAARSDGPAPESTQPSAPAARARAPRPPPRAGGDRPGPGEPAAGRPRRPRRRHRGGEPGEEPPARGLMQPVVERGGQEIEPSAAPRGEEQTHPLEVDHRVGARPRRRQDRARLTR